MPAAIRTVDALSKALGEIALSLMPTIVVYMTPGILALENQSPMHFPGNLARCVAFDADDTFRNTA